MPACEVCYDLTESPPSHAGDFNIQLYPTVRDLEQSAERGCVVCALIHRGIVSDGNPRSDDKSSSDDTHGNFAPDDGSSGDQAYNSMCLKI